MVTRLRTEELPLGMTGALLFQESKTVPEAPQQKSRHNKKRTKKGRTKTVPEARSKTVPAAKKEAAKKEAAKKKPPKRSRPRRSRETGQPARRRRPAGGL